jgi:hypothetical protein
LFPGTTANIFSVVNRLLPSVGGIGTRAAKGEDSFSSISPSWITALGEKAAKKNNEISNHKNRLKDFLK